MCSGTRSANFSDRFKAFHHIEIFITFVIEWLKHTGDVPSGQIAAQPATPHPRKNRATSLFVQTYQENPP